MLVFAECFFRDRDFRRNRAGRSVTEGSKGKFEQKAAKEAKGIDHVGCLPMFYSGIVISGAIEQGGGSQEAKRIFEQKAGRKRRSS
jgi:hypothetical protein